MRLFRLLCAVVLLFTFSSCGEEDKTANKKIQLLAEKEINQQTPEALLQTVGKIIKLQDTVTLIKLYTPESRKAIRFNNRIGVGTAGTVDEQIHNEMQGKKHATGEIKVITTKKKKGYTAAFVEWPSSRRFTVAVTQISNRYYLDAIKSFGGKILLLEKTNKPPVVADTQGPQNRAIKTGPSPRKKQIIKKTGRNRKKPSKKR